MAPAKPTDEEWLTLRRKHDMELNDFGKQVQVAKIKFENNVQKGRAEILARHESEEKEYWAGKSNASKNSAANKPTASKEDVKNEVNGKATTKAETPVSRLRQTPALSSRTSQTPKPAQARSSAATPATQPTNKKAAVTYINLCSDDDDDEPVVVRKKSAPTKTHDAQVPQANPAFGTTVDLAARQDPPAYTIPPTNLTLFGNTSKTVGGTPEPSGFKREHTATPAENNNGGYVAPVPASTLGQLASTTAFSPHQATFGSHQRGFSPFAQPNGTGRSTSRHGTLSSPFAQYAPASAPSNVTNNIASPTGFAHWNTQVRASTIAPQSPVLGRASSSQQPVFHGLPMGDGSAMQSEYSSSKPESTVSDKRAGNGGTFLEYPAPHSVSGDTHTRQQQTFAPVRDSQIGHDDQDMPMNGAPQSRPLVHKVIGIPTNTRTAPPHQTTSSKSPRTFQPQSQPQQHTPNMLPSPSHTSDSLHTPTPRQPVRAHQPSPTPSVPELPTPTPTSASSFKRPYHPASATDILLDSRNTRAESQASSATLRASTIPQSERGTPVSPSPASVMNPRKRKVVTVDISSGEESDYTPPSEDDEEPESPEGLQTSPKSRKDMTKKSVPGPPLKKAKIPPLPPAIASEHVFSRGKNSFGFHVPPKPKAGPSAPTKAQNHPSTPNKSKQRQSTSIASPSRTPTRKAKIQAEEKIAQLSEATSQYWAEEPYAETNEHEEPVKARGTVEERLRSMSITPAPAIHRDENVSQLVDASEIPSPHNRARASSKSGGKQKDDG